MSKREQNEPIAIIGMGCRFPGAADSPDAFWELLKNGFDAIREVPADRFDIDELYDPDLAKPGKVVARYGGFINDIDKFDANFFGISPWEAARLDPQQRLLLEVAWEALEDAGQPLEKISGSQTGVFVGIYSSDFENRLFAEFDEIDLYSATGTALYSAAGRLSYAYDLRGPSMAVGTACSSSMVSAHLAVNSLRNGDCEMALAGGVNLVLNPHLSIAYSKGGMLSPDGRCRFGDAGANGFVRGEGCGMIILKPLPSAIEDGDRIYALIAGSAVNNDGRRGHFLAPSPEGQADVLRNAYRNAGVHPKDVHYIEAHGTGTTVGDPIEIESLNQVIGENRSAEKPCLVGSVKTNFGHLEGASGIAGLIKAALCIYHRQIPPSLHFEKPSPRIPWADLKVKIQSELISIPADQHPFTIGVNAFGLTGMNAHVVLQEAAPSSTVASGVDVPIDDASGIALLPLSARGVQALADTARTWIDFLETNEGAGGATLNEICSNASLRRTHHNHRLAVIGHDKEEIMQQLAKHVAIPAEGILTSEENLNQKIKEPVFVFSGQGQQWFAMGRDLFAHEPVFREVMVRCANYLRGYADWDLLDELGRDEKRSRLDQTEIAQPAIFAIQMALTQLLQSWGIVPGAVVGHSVGEVAAVCAAGLFTLEDALRIVFHRGRILQKTTGSGRMAAIGLSMAEAQALIETHQDRLSIAAVNSPKSVTLSGEEEALLAVLDTIDNHHVFKQLMNVNYAFHSHLVSEGCAEMMDAVKDIKPQKALIPIVSTVTGCPVSDETFGATYWGENIRQTVKFESALNWLMANQYRTFIEISAHPVLSLSVSQCLSAQQVGGDAMPTLERKKNDRHCMAATLAALYTKGHKINWSAIYAQPSRFVNLPHYAWNRSRHWIDPSPSHKPVTKGSRARELPPGQANLATHYYRIAWQPRSPDVSVKKAHLDKSAKWLIFKDRDGIAEHLAQLLQSEGLDCIMVEPGQRYAILDENKFCIDPIRFDDYRQLLHELITKRQTRLHGTIHLWSLLASQPEDTPAEQLHEEALRNCISALYLCQCFSQEETKTATKLWLITKGAQPVDKGPRSLSLAQSPLWGFGRVAALEVNRIWGGLVDLDPEMDSRGSAQRLCDEILMPDGEDQIAFRGNQRYAARLIRKQPTREVQATGRWRKDGAYLITGGLGKLGLKLAHWMAQQGAGHLVLVGRQGLPIEDSHQTSASMKRGGQKSEAINTIRNLGTEVTVVSADVGNMDAMADLLATFGNERPPLSGIVHAAGIIDPKPLLDLDISDLQSAFNAKVLGTWVLHELTRHSNLDFIVLFSSAASVLGSKDLAHYAAANHFLDMYAHYARSGNQPVSSINWGWWVGGWKDDHLTKHLSQAGLHAISDEDGMTALNEVLSAETAQTMYADIDWRILAPIYETQKRRPFLDEIRLADLGQSLPEKAAVDDVMKTLEKALPRDRLKKLQDFISKEIAQLLGFQDPVQLDPTQGFFQMGMDSIKAVQIRDRIQEATGLALAPTVAFECPNILSLTQYVLELAFNHATDEEQRPDEIDLQETNEPMTSSDRDQMSEEQLVELISKKLKKL